MRLGPDGLFVAGSHVADLGQVIEHVARADVVEIRLPAAVRGSAVGAWVGEAVGSFLGFLSGLHFGLHEGRCGSCNTKAWLSLFGIPVGVAVLGFTAFAHRGQQLIYHRGRTADARVCLIAPA